MVKGVTKGNSNGDFSINFYNGSNKRQALLHYRALLEDKKVICNSQSDFYKPDDWKTQKEAKFEQNYPFQFGKAFIITVKIIYTEFQISANGNEIIKMHFQDPSELIFSKLTGFEIIGNNGLTVHITEVLHQ